jgi:hypothetical protein
MEKINQPCSKLVNIKVGEYPLYNTEEEIIGHDFHIDHNTVYQQFPWVVLKDYHGRSKLNKDSYIAFLTACIQELYEHQLILLRKIDELDKDNIKS